MCFFYIINAANHLSRFMINPDFHKCKNKGADQLCSNCTADQRLVFAIMIVQSLFFLNPKFQASSHLLWLCSLVCVAPGWKPRRPVFSHRGSFAVQFEMYSTFSEKHVNLLNNILKT